MVVLSLIFFATPVKSQAPIEDEPPLSTKEELVAYATKQAIRAQISPDVVLHIIQHESNWNTEAEGDMNRICSRTGRAIRARGLVQITECYYPNISDVDAFNPKFAINFLISKLREGECRSQWSTCPL